MRITHKLPKLNISKDCDTSSFILSNRIGSFLFLSESPISKFNGFFLNKGLEIYKFIENIGIVDRKTDEIENNLNFIKRKCKLNTDKIECIEGVDGIHYSLAKKAKVFIDFDCRKIADYRNYGRYYDISFKKNTIIIKFTKKTDSKEDDSNNREEFSLFTAIQPKSFSIKKDYSFIDEWKEQGYEYDISRGDPTPTRFVYRPFTIKAKELLIAFGTTEKEALAELEKLNTRNNIKEEHKTIDKKRNQEAAAALICAQNSLDSLQVEYEDIIRLYAGYPWFFQMWSRDENISIGALIKLKRFKEAKHILFKYLDNFGKDGRLPNHIPSPHLGSADGVGWYWKRIGDLIDTLESANAKEKHLTKKETSKLAFMLEESIKRIEKSYKKDELITNGHKETWMDTDWQGQDGREGARIEIQALHLNMLRLASRITGKKKYQARESKLKKTVLAKFWNRQLLADGVDDLTQRPNIFIAYYAYPDLLSRREWQTAFEYALSRIWLEWGGVATIDKDNHLFQPKYTGADDQSYHRGDSWYWINNLAAICMFRNNPIEFEQKIFKIIDASSKEILWNGAVGHAAEVSDASVLSSKGCFAQAWSDSMFIELVLEVFSDGK